MKKTAYQTEKSFAAEVFDAPTVFAAPLYSWIWNSPITESLIDEQLDEMQEEGIRAFYIIPEPTEFRPSTMRTTLTPSYLSEDFFRLIRYTAASARKRGMLMWLYDEGGWPSGGAAGRVVEAYPAGIAKRLRESVIRLEKGETLEGKDLFAVFCGEERAALPYTAEKRVELKIYEIEEINKQSPLIKLPHLLDERAVEEFLHTTHEKYRDSVGSEFGEGICAMFTDEARLFYPFYWEDRAEWEKETEWRLEEMAPALFGDFKGDQGKKFRVAYIDRVSRELAERYLKRIHDWCRNNDLLFTGHMDGDHRLSDFRSHGGNLLLHLRQMDIPGVDCIWRQLFPGQENVFFPRFASSAATQVGSNYAVSESFAVYGDGVTFSQMRWVVGYQAVRGINLLNIMSITSGREEFLSAQCRPHFVGEKENVHQLAFMNSYWERLFALLSLGKRSPRAALYVPERGVWAEEKEDGFYAFGRRLEEHQIDFDLVDDVFLEQAAFDDGAFRMGHARYEILFVPQTDWMSGRASERIASFGGKVYRENVTDETLDGLAVLSCRAESIRALERKGEGFRLVMLWNEAAERQCFRVALDDERKFITRLDPVTGRKICLSPGENSFTLESGEELLILFSDEDPGAEQAVTCEKVMELAPPLLRAESRTVLRDGGFRKEAAHGDAVTKPFSGVAKAQIAFAWSEAGDAMLEFPESEIPLRIELNGKTVGDVLFPPYRALLPAALLRPQNDVVLTLFSHAAQAVAEADLSRYPQNMIGPYHAKHTRPFECEGAAPVIGKAVVYRIR